MCGESQVIIGQDEFYVYLGACGCELCINDLRYAPQRHNKLKGGKKIKEKEQKVRELLTNLGTDTLADLIIEWTKYGQEG
jgi:hypothetical protein